MAQVTGSRRKRAKDDREWPAPLDSVWASGHTALVGIDPGGRYIGLAVALPDGTLTARRLRSGTVGVDAALDLGEQVYDIAAGWGPRPLVAVEVMQVDGRTTAGGRARAHAILAVQATAAAVAVAIRLQAPASGVLMTTPREWKRSARKGETWDRIRAAGDLWAAWMAEAPNADARDAVALAGWASMYAAARAWLNGGSDDGA